MTEDKVLKNAQYRKGLGIAWFNATNSAIEMVKVEHAMGMFTVQSLLNVNIKPFKKSKKKGVKKGVKKETTATVSLNKAQSIEDRISYWRSKFLEDHKVYYAEVVSQIGTNYDVSKTIELLKKTKNRNELKLVWTAMSEDERHDGEIRKITKELKKSYEKQ